MQDVAVIFGYHVTIAQVYAIAGQCVPVLLGLLSTWIMSQMKLAGLKEFVAQIASDVPPAYLALAQCWLMRACVAVVCVILNGLMVAIEGGHLTAAILWQGFLSYMAAVMAYEHQDPVPVEAEAA